MKLFFYIVIGLLGMQLDTTAQQYRNPVLHADFSDPDVIQVNGVYYMTASSFNHVPGLPLLRSEDLVHWELVGYALKKLIPEDVYNKVQHGGGVWAPAIRYQNNRFVIYYPDPDFGIYRVEAKKFTGPWSDPVLVQAGKGLIDPCPFWDDNGKAYLIHAYAGSRAGIKSVLVVREMNPEGTVLTGDPVLVYDGHEKDPTIEGPKLYKRNGYYYIFAPAGGVKTGWQTVLRSRTIYGPYERKVVLEQGSTAINGPHQGAWVRTPAGADWFLHFQDKEAYGRIVHLQPMVWKNDWPVIGEDKDGDGKGNPVQTWALPVTSKTSTDTLFTGTDRFDDPNRFSMAWQWRANPRAEWAYTTAQGYLRLNAVLDTGTKLWDLPSILTQKLIAEKMRVTVKVRFQPRMPDEEFGLVVIGTDMAGVFLKQKDSVMTIRCATLPGADKGGGAAKVVGIDLKETNTFIYLRFEVAPGAQLSFSASADGKKFLDFPVSVAAKPGKWVGATWGLFCSRSKATNDAGWADIDEVIVEKL